ncbi:MAG: IS1595 family transposase [Chthoniobacterales bacterium]|nr:MAG: IS1595 family transposase [Chthoniobacterales bacterium]
MSAPKTLQEAIIHFADYDNCRKFMTDLRWADGKVTCPRCGSEHVIYLEKARVWKCYGKHESPKFSLKTRTIFEDSPLGLDKWLPVMWLLVNSKNGVSSWEIHRAMGVTQKTAWFMLQRGRLAMQGDTHGKLSGEVEVDETFIGGKARNMHSEKRKAKIQGRGVSGKTVVMGMLQRGGKVRTAVIEDRNKPTLHGHVEANVAPGASVFTDELVSYWGLEEKYVHEIINHAERYVRGNVHTNGMENFWSLLKRGLNGTYVSVEPFHLFRYIDEQAFRYNNRITEDGEKLTDADRFNTVMSQIVGKRLTYKELTGKEGETEAF